MMRKAWLVTTLAVAVVCAASVAVKAQTYGPGYMMGPGYGGGYGSGHGYMMGPGYGYDRDDDRGYRRGRSYRDQRMCWHYTDRERGHGYYAACR